MKTFKRAFSNRVFTCTVFFLVFLFFLEEYLFDFPQLRLFQQVLVYRPPNEVRILIASAIGSYALCCLIIWAALTSSRIFQVLYTFLFGLAMLVQYGFWKAVGRFVSSADLRIAAATPFNTWKGAGSIYFDWHFILPVTMLIVLILFGSQPQPWKSSLVKFVSIFILIGSLNLIYTFTDHNLNLGLSVTSFYQTIARYLIDDALPVSRDVIAYQSSVVPQNNIVFVIDESIRGDHLFINGYSRQTTPFLTNLSQTNVDFDNFGLAVAGATCSYPSNALLLTGVRPGIDDFKLVENYPTIFQYAKAMGYKTYYMDAQTNSLWNGLTDRDLSYIDSWYKAADFGDDNQSDFHAANQIAEIVSGGTGNFIVLNKRGVHFLYESSYPFDKAVWLPLPTDYTTQPELVSNSYDNGILYNVNSFFERLLVNPEILGNTVIVYTSDHGQTLFENHVSWLHCNYTKQEATIPLILIGRNLPAVDVEYDASHSNILPTILDLMNVPKEQRAHTYAASLFSVTRDMVTDRFFFSGSLQLIDFPDP